jgi:Ca-activated chloride channel homolog
MKTFITISLILLFSFSIFAQKQAQVIVTSTFIRKEPNSTSEKVQTVQKGDRLTLEKNRDTNGWYYVSVLNRTVKGWIRKDTITSNVNLDVDIQRPKRVALDPTPAENKKPTANITSSVVKSVVKPVPSATKPTITPKPSPTITIEDEEIIRVDTEETSLNVRVVDTSNRRVKNLNQSNFKVYEDGVLQTITSLTDTQIPTINALLIDNSRSLRSQLTNITEAGKIIVVKNLSVDESAVIRFVGADKIDVVQDFTVNQSSLIQALDNLFVEGGRTAVIDAVYLAANKIDTYQNSAQKDDIRSRALILISDGDDRSSSHSEEQLFELLRKSQVQIYAVGLITNLSEEPDASGVNRHEKAKAFLKRLTEETGGKVYFPNSIDELPKIATDIHGELHTQYLISYTPTNENRDGKFRQIKVTVDDGANKEKRFAITRKGRISAVK